MDEAAARPPGRKRKVAALVAGAALLPLGLGLWSQRRPIAHDFVDRELAARGVAGSYVINDLGLGRQRLTKLVIGDPASPDLTADEVELRIGYGLGWPAVRGVRARGVRLRGRLVGGTVTFGAVDRLLPPPNGAPFSLPDIAVDLADTRIDLATPAGAVLVRVAGRGNLADGFAGRVAAAMPAFAASGCRAERVSAAFAVRVMRRRPVLSGPLRAERLRCGDAGVIGPRGVIDAELGEALRPERARVTLATNAVTGGAAAGGVTARSLRGAADYARDGDAGHGDFSLTALDPARAGDRAGEVSMQGRYRDRGVAAGDARLLVDATLGLRGGRLDPAWLRAIGRGAVAVAGSPLAPVVDAWAAAARRAGRSIDGSAEVRFAGAGISHGEVTLSRLDLVGRSGARLALAGGAGVRAMLGGDAPMGRTVRIDTRIRLSGGGLPSVLATARQEAGRALTGQIAVAPYHAGAAGLTLTPVRFTRTAGGLEFATVATVDGPLAGGMVRGLTLPIDGHQRAGLTINPQCVPLRFTALSLAGVDLGATRLLLCPRGGAMLRIGPGGASGGLATPRPRLTGTVGRQPLTIAADDLTVTIGRPGFLLNRLAVLLGGEQGTRLDVATLAGSVAAGGIGGRFTDASGQIANVPLLLSGGEGDWRLARGRLTLAGGLTVADAAAAPRFNPLRAQNVTLDLTNGVIRAGGTLREPASGLAISEVALAHDLARGSGSATLAVPGITFGPAFQPEALTRLTLGVVANVVGTVKGAGEIRWSPAGVASSGDFATEGTDLAAAFGQVSGIRTSIHFSDLLGLSTPPGQIATIAAINPGIAVEGGVIGYQLLPNQQVAVGGGKWPFSGGALILEPTVLDFGRPVERRLTFRVEGMQAGAFLSQFDFKNIAATGVFDGTLPLIFDDEGGRITGGRLVVRPGGGTLAYVGELTNKDLGLFGKLAFDALKAIRYDNLAIELDGALDSEIVSRIVFTGVNENPAPEKKAKGLLKNLTGLPFRFNIMVRAPFRGLTSSAAAFANPGGLIRGAATTPAAAPAVQPPLSEDKR